MKTLLRYREFTQVNTDPSIIDSFMDKPYPNKSKIVNYMRRGKARGASASVCKDIVTGERIPITEVYMHDGTYSWDSELIYYVEKYNMRLPKEFEDYVVKQG